MDTECSSGLNLFHLHLLVIMGAPVNISGRNSRRTHILKQRMKLVQAMLDKLALQLERRKLIAENQTLQKAMDKWLDGFRITDKSKERANALMVSGLLSIPFKWVALEFPDFPHCASLITGDLDVPSSELRIASIKKNVVNS